MQLTLINNCASGDAIFIGIVELHCLKCPLKIFKTIDQPTNCEISIFDKKERSSSGNSSNHKYCVYVLMQ